MPLRAPFRSVRSRPVRRLLRGALIGAAVACAVLALRGTSPLRAAEARSYDLRARWTADPASADTSIVIAAIDDNSLEVYREALGRWPWPRDVHGALVAYLHAAGARLVVFDVLFPEPDLANPASDTAFAQAVADAGNVVLPLTFTPGNARRAAVWDSLRAAEQADRARADSVLRRSALGPAAGAAMEHVYVEPPATLFAGAARALGSVTLTADGDGVVRGDRPVYAHRGRVYPSLALAAARALHPERFGGAVAVGAREARIGSERVPLHEGRMLLRWRGPYLSEGRSAYRVIPAFHLLNSYQQVAAGLPPDVPMEQLEGKTVFVAPTAPGLFDARTTPLRPADPGVLIHATALDGLLKGDHPRRASAPANAAALVVAALAAAAIVSVAGSALAGGAGALAVVLLSWGGAVLAYGNGVWLDMAAPLLAGALAAAAAMGGNFVAEGREKRRVRELFGRYLSPEVARRLADDPEAVRLGGERATITLLFSDIRGFTSLSERLPAERVVEILNEYLEAMTAVVFRHEGTVDKFIGDAVMAFWGAPLPVPDHARRAVRAALEMRDELHALNQKWTARGTPVNLRIGIGIHTGEAIVGNIGSLSRKLDYTAIGDTVNLTSRLEGLNRDFGTDILVSDAARDAAGDGFDFQPLGEVHVKGKETGVHVHAVRAAREAAATLALVLALVGAPVDARAQAQGQRAHWSAWIYQPGRWAGGRLVDRPTRTDHADSLALVARAEIYIDPPRWRVDLQKVEGAALAPALSLVSPGAGIRVVTPVGSTPLEQHTGGRDAVVQFVTRSMAGLDASSARVVERAPSGQILWVMVRRRNPRAEFGNGVFETGRAGLIGRRAASLGLRAAGGERNQEAVASAGARGVTTVRTALGTVQVEPDPAAVRALEAYAPGPVELDEFMAAGGLGAHAPQAAEGR